METCLYAGPSWGTVFEEKGYEWYAPQAQDSGQWYGHKNTWTISESGDFRPWVKYHYVPSLVGVVNDATLGPEQRPEKRASRPSATRRPCSSPQNLRITSSSSRVALGKKATFRGTFALDGAWQREGARVSLQMQNPVRKTWQTVKSVTTTSERQVDRPVHAEADGLVPRYGRGRRCHRSARQSTRCRGWVRVV